VGSGAAYMGATRAGWVCTVLPQDQGSCEWPIVVRMSEDWIQLASAGGEVLVMGVKEFSLEGCML
jgi:hypothetical protein